MQGFKNLMKPNLYTQDAIQTFNKKVQEIRKVTNAPLDQFESLVAVTQSIVIQLEKWLIDYQICEIEELKKSIFWVQLVQICKKVSTNQKTLAGQLRAQFMQTNRQIKNNSILQLQRGLQFVSKVRNYKSKEQVLLQGQKKYTKLYKNMLTSIENYKKTFTDVKMIYNKEEKNKRYCLCEATYEEMMAEYNQIIQTVAIMNQSKKDIIQSFNKYVGLTGKGIKNIGSKTLGLSKKYLELSFQKEFACVNIFTTEIEKFQKILLQFQFNYPTADTESQEYLRPGNYSQKHPFIPRIIINYQHLKETHCLHLGVLLVNYQKELGQLIKRRKTTNRQVLDYVGYFVKAYQKVANMHRDFSNGFQKKKRKFVDFYGVNNYFLASFSNVFGTLELIQEKNTKFFASKYKIIEQNLNQQSKLLQALQKDFRVIIMQKFVSKKEAIKKKSSLQKVLVEVQIEVKSNQSQLLKIQTFEKMVCLKQIFETYYQKVKKNCNDLKQHINSILLTFEKSTIEVYTSIKAEIELDKQNNERNRIKQEELDEKVLAKNKIFQESVFSGLFTQQANRITFDGDLNKVEEFKKLKKPQQIMQQQNKNKEKTLEEQSKNKQKEDTPELKRKDNLNQQENCEEQSLKRISTEKSIKQGGSQAEGVENISKYQKLLYSKISLLPNERYIQSYVCGLADNIILAGRIFITNQRLCFFSKFNPKNIFFGETFIEIPKKDIKKIEKRQNAVVFNNSISITTIHGQMFFTSFVSRNQAYDRILQALQLNFEDIMYEPEQIREINIEQEVVGEQEDDIKQQQLLQRQKSIDALLKKNDYKQIMNTTLSFKDMTPLKYFKLFQMDQQISYNRGRFLGFQGYFKNMLGYTEVNSEEWSPSVLEYFNSSNIKADMPLFFSKKVTQIIPVVNSGIPFMPKTSHIQEKMTLYFYSRHKIVIETEVKSSGVPYCDYFYLTYRKQVTTSELNTICWKVFYSITFVTNTMVKGVIQTRSLEQSKISMKKLQEEMKKYLKFLQKISSKTNAATTNKQIGNEQPSNESTNGNANDQELNLEIETLSKQKEVLDASLSIQTKAHSKTKKILLASVLLNIALLLFLMI